MTVVLWPILLAVPLGMLVGATGVGGFLLVPVMMLAGFDAATAVMAALVANVTASTGMVGLVIRRQSVSWRTFYHLCVGTAVGVAVTGALLSAVDDRVGANLTAALLAVSGVVVIAHALHTSGPSSPRPQAFGFVALIGVFAQMSSVFAGIGGPAITVPALLALGMRQSLAIGTGIAHGVVVSSLAISSLLVARGIAASATEAILPAAVLAGVAVFVRSRLDSASRRRWLEVVVGVLALLGSWSALSGRVT